MISFIGQQVMPENGMCIGEGLELNFAGLWRILTFGNQKVCVHFEHSTDVYL